MNKAPNPTMELTGSARHASCCAPSAPPVAHLVLVRPIYLYTIMDSHIRQMMEAERESAIRQNAAMEAQALMPSLLSGEASFIALKQSVNELARLAPADHDVLVEAFNLLVTKVFYVEPHSLLFRGFNQEGHDAFVICHFSQLVARVVYHPKRGSDRIITGFAANQ